MLAFVLNMGKKLLLQYLLSVFLGLHLLTSKYLLDDALLINNKGGADGAAPIACNSVLSTSAINGKGNSCFSLNLTCEAAESLLTPTTS